MISTAKTRFFSKVALPDENGCCLWQGKVSSRGYGRIAADGRLMGAHRFAYEYLVGPIPQGLVIDHLCEVKRCVAPDHLEPVTAVENTLRWHRSRTANAVQLVRADVQRLVARCLDEGVSYAEVVCWVKVGYGVSESGAKRPVRYSRADVEESVARMDQAGVAYAEIVRRVMAGYGVSESTAKRRIRDSRAAA